MRAIRNAASPNKNRRSALGVHRPVYHISAVATKNIDTGSNHEVPKNALLYSSIIDIMYSTKKLPSGMRTFRKGAAISH